jgi:hypothetical protein
MNPARCRYKMMIDAVGGRCIRETWDLLGAAILSPEGSEILRPVVDAYELGADTEEFNHSNVQD